MTDSFNAYDERERGSLSPGLRKVIEDIVTGQDVPCSDTSVAHHALESLAMDLAVLETAYDNGCSTAALMLSRKEIDQHLARLVVRARAIAQLTELLELQPDESEESQEAAE